MIRLSGQKVKDRGHFVTSGTLKPIAGTQKIFIITEMVESMVQLYTTYGG